MKIGIIGLGDIANKAYLPIYSSKKDVEFHLYTRNIDQLKNISEKYRFKEIHLSIDALINSGIKGVFVHSATESHYDIVELLLLNNIHVYVDKPITYDNESTKRLVEMAKRKNLLLMSGFNRRFAPTYQNLKELKDPNMIIMQKNRKSLPDDIRRFVFDDFIHVIDTLLYLFPHPIENIVINGRKKDNALYHVVVQFISRECTAIGIMNRDSGTVEEKLEIMSTQEKRVVTNVSDLVIHNDRNMTKIGFSDWEPTLYKRGFEQIVSNFIQAITNSPSNIKYDDLLLTHEICEKIVKELTVGE